MNIKRPRSWIAILFSFLFATGTAQADQNDPRLDILFRTLQSIEASRAPQSIVDRIWTIWIETPDPDLRATMQHGIAAMARHDLSAALETFDAVIESAPDYAEGWNKRATVYFMMGQYNASMSDVHAVLGLEPRHFGALSGMGLIFMETGNDQRALQAFQEAIKVNPHMPTIQEYIIFLKEKIERNTI